jgi:hypothetical protein
MSLDTLVLWGTLGIGAILVIYDIKLMLAPQMRGHLVSVENQLERASKACDCSEIGAGRSYVNAKVELDDGRTVDVNVSPCLVCMDRVRVGSQIGVTRVGERLVGRRYIDLLGRGARARAMREADVRQGGEGGCT